MIQGDVALAGLFLQAWMETVKKGVMVGATGFEPATLTAKREVPGESLGA